MRCGKRGARNSNSSLEDNQVIDVPVLDTELFIQIPHWKIIKESAGATLCLSPEDSNSSLEDNQAGTRQSRDRPDIIQIPHWKIIKKEYNVSIPPVSPYSNSSLEDNQVIRMIQN